MVVPKNDRAQVACHSARSFQKPSSSRLGIVGPCNPRGCKGDGDRRCAPVTSPYCNTATSWKKNSQKLAIWRRENVWHQSLLRGKKKSLWPSAAKQSLAGHDETILQVHPKSPRTRHVGPGAPRCFVAISGKNKLMCYPQQLGRSWRVFGYLPRNSREPHQPSAPEPAGTSSAFCPATLRNLVCYLPRNPPEPHQQSAPELLEGLCTGTLQNLISNLHQNSWKASAPEPSGTSLAICTGTLRNLISYLPRNSPEPHQLSSPKPFGTSSAICTGTLRNLISHLHRKDPEPSGTFSGTWCCSCTGSHQSYSGLKTP